MTNFSQQLKLHLKNIQGWKTPRKIVVFAVDDYGNVRVHSKSAREKMDRAGLKIQSRFDAFDSLENEEDLLMLYDTLTSVRDSHGNHAIMTALTVVANINFDKQVSSDKYEYETLPDTFSKLGNEVTWALWKEGIEKKLMFPQFHGREHLNIKVLEVNLANNDYSTRVALENRSYTSIVNSYLPLVSYTAAFDFTSLDEIDEQKTILIDGLNLFENIFGFRSITFNPPGGREHSRLHQTLKDQGVDFIETPMIKKEHEGWGKFSRHFNFTGKIGLHNQTFLVRNCVFEPTSDRSIDWVSYCLNQIEVAFQWKRPAIISSHRVNFSGYIDSGNRKIGIASLRSLFREIMKRWPDVEFMSTADLGLTICKGS